MRALIWSPYLVITLGEKLLPLDAYPDKLAILEAMQLAAKHIADHFEDYLEDNYGRHDVKYFKKYLSDLTTQIKKLHDAGKKSGVFSRYKTTQDQEQGSLANEIAFG